MVASDNPELLGFLRQLFPCEENRLTDRTVGLVLADWLEENDDPRAADVRAMASLCPQPQRPVADSTPAEGEEPQDPPQPIWRWPGPDDQVRSWWDLLVEYSDDGRVYARWHADPMTDAGRALAKHARVYFGYSCSTVEKVNDALESCLVQLILATLGWSADSFWEE